MASYLEICEQAARAGGAVLLDWRDRITAREKGPRDLVTEADFASQRAIAEIIETAFPDHAFLGEEDIEGQKAQAEASTSGFRWIVDPLDGTVNYVHGMNNFSVSIALEQEGSMIAGVVYDPVADECYAAAVGQGATLNGKPIAVSNCQQLEEALIAASFSAGTRSDSMEVARFAEVLGQCQAIRRLGSAALNLSYAAAGRLDAYWADSVKIWDIAAGVLILQEAGGVVSHLDGGAYQSEDPKIVVAATPSLHEQLLRVMRSTEKAYGAR
jgi:myo-inositol-1(or 4)-monophosphatase